MQATNAAALGRERRAERSRNHSDAITVAFARADGQLAPVEVDVLDAELERFEQAQARAV